MESKTEYPPNHRPPEETPNPRYKEAFNNYRKIQILKQEYFKLKEKSFIDSLTDCYNRNAWEDYQKHIDLNRGNSLTLIAIDINGLKTINDTKGHDAGDRLIKNTALYLQEVFSRKGDRVFRIGGDEFVIACDYVDPTKRDSFNSFIDLNFNQENLNQKGLDFAVGISHSNPDTDSSVSDTLKRADKKMYQNKQKQKSQNPSLYSR